MPKFFVTNEQVKDGTITIQGKDVNHIKHVLRMKIGEIIHICNTNQNQDYISKIEMMTEKAIFCKIIEYEETKVESNVKVSIFQGLPKSDKMELVIQKAIELGVNEIYPVQMKRCVVQLKDQNKKIQRWQTIAEVASKQCGRSMIPKIQNCITIQDICQMSSQFDAILVAYEQEKIHTLKAELQLLKKQYEKENTLKIGIVIGPEGGLATEEVELLQNYGGKSVTLGKRILRTETVALNVLSNIMYEFEG